MDSENVSETDDEMFYPIVDLKEGQKSDSDADDQEYSSDKQEHAIKSEDDLNAQVRKQAAKKLKTDHRKIVRRKLEEDLMISSELDRITEAKKLEVRKREKRLQKQKEKIIAKVKKKKKTLGKQRAHVKQEPGMENGFEFCPTDMKGVEEIKIVVDIKQEVTSDAEETNDENKNSSIQKSDDDSDDDMPLSFLEKQKEVPEKILKLKRTYAEDKDDDLQDKKVKKIKIKKLQMKKLKVVTNANGDIECKECSKTFKNKSKYRTHYWKVHKKAFSCGICSRQFHTQLLLEDHYNNHTGHRPYCCYLCDDTMFKTERSLKNHMKSAHSEGGSSTGERKQYPCAYCNKILSSASCLQEHTRLHTGEKPVTCQLCGKHFTRERDMKQHLNLHDEVWKCDLCQRCFLTPFKLKEHYRSHTGELPYECDKCDRKFARVADFRYHIGTHLGLKPYACEQCGMRFTTSSSVTRHRLNMHQTGPKLYKCPQCAKRFHTETRLKTHIKNHENSKKFRCDLCPVARSSLAELNKHAVIHGGEFRCDTCHRSCSSAERLAAHVARHDLEGKPYACFVCSLGYRSMQSLNKHLSTVHKNEDIPKIAPQHLCMLCGQVFELKDKLNRHLKDSHVVICIGEIEHIDDPENEQAPDIETKPVIENDLKGDTKHSYLEPDEDKRVVDLRVTQVYDRKIEISVPPITTTNIVPLITELKTERPTNINIPKKIEILENSLQEGEQFNKKLMEEEEALKEKYIKEATAKEKQKEEMAKERQKVEILKEKLKEEIAFKEIQKEKILKEALKEEIMIKEKQRENLFKEALKEETVTLEKEKQTKLNEKLAESSYNKEFMLKEQFSLFDYAKMQDRNIVNIPKPGLNSSIIEDLVSKNYINHEQKAISQDYRLSSQHNKNFSHDQIKRQEQKFLHHEQKKLIDDKFLNHDQKVSNPCRNSVSITVPTVPQNLGILDNFGVKDLSASANQSTELLKAQKLLAHRAMYDSPYMRVPYSNPVTAMTQQNRLLQHTYRNIEEATRPQFEGYQQIQVNAEHSINPWFLPSAKNNDRESGLMRQTTSKNQAEARPRYGELRMPRVDTLQMEQPDYRNFTSHQRASGGHRQETSQQQSPHHKEMPNERKYYYDSTPERKSYTDTQSRQASTDDRRKYPQIQLSSPSNEITSKHSARDYSGHMMPNREFNVQSPLGVRDFSNSTGSDSQSPHYTHHSFASMASSPHNLFQNFRELQHRMLGASGIQDYPLQARQTQLSGMDMTSQRLLNPTSPLSPYHHPGAHMSLDTLSPMSRNTYEDITNPHNTSSAGFQNSGHPSSRLAQAQNGESTQGKDGNASEQIGPYEMRVAAS